ncbi:MAG: hypothetical protein KGI63_13720 [Xanthomonadaceae bacterium]|nr:hypothetical protein [Xanthomonadaceae bacterium]MDE2088283.1 hypothetical protein [Xanthomonadaceae bacterium]MDE3210624.1 hypothetical protein [Pseudomonadota bacterium]
MGDVPHRFNLEEVEVLPRDGELVLVTDNLREFRSVPGLRCGNWMR